MLRETDAPHRLLPILVGPNEASAIALALSGQAAPRPLTHDLMAALIAAFDADVEAVEVTKLRHGTFHAELAVKAPGGTRRLDSRPSDAIALAVRVGAPIFVHPSVLDQAGTMIDDKPDEESIDAVVAEFRQRLEELDPTELRPEDEGDDPA